MSIPLENCSETQRVALVVLSKWRLHNVLVTCCNIHGPQYGQNPGYGTRHTSQSEHDKVFSWPKSKQSVPPQKLVSLRAVMAFSI